MKNYLITGIAGTGKSTIGETLADQGYKVIEFDGAPSEKITFRPSYRTKYDRRTDKPSRFVRGSGWEELQYIDWRVDRDKLLPELKGGNNQTQFIIGYANNWEEFKGDFDGIFLLEVDKATIRRRLLSRVSGDWGRKHPEELQHALETAGRFNNSLKGLGAVSINANAPVSVIVEEIISSTRGAEV